MPGLVRLYVRTSLVYLAIGGLLGGLLLWNKGPVLSPNMWVLLGAHIALMTWGWLLHLTLGVAYWILPRIAGERPHASLAVIAYGSLNGGLLLAALQPWFAAAWLSVAAGALQFLAAVVFTAHAWPRIRPAGSSTH